MEAKQMTKISELNATYNPVDVDTRPGNYYVSVVDYDRVGLLLDHSTITPLLWPMLTAARNMPGKLTIKPSGILTELFVSMTIPSLDCSMI